MRLLGGRWGDLRQNNNNNSTTTRKRVLQRGAFLFVYGEVRARGSRDCLAVRVRRPSTRFDEGGQAQRRGARGRKQ